MNCIINCHRVRFHFIRSAELHVGCQYIESTDFELPSYLGWKEGSTDTYNALRVADNMPKSVEPLANVFIRSSILYNCIMSGQSPVIWDLLPLGYISLASEETQVSKCMGMLL